MNRILLVLFKTFLLLPFHSIGQENSFNLETADKKIIYSSIPNDLKRITGLQLKYISFNDSLFTPSNDKWVTFGNGEKTAIHDSTIKEIFVENLTNGKFLFKDSITVNEGDWQITSFKELSNSSLGIDVSYSDINFSRKRDYALLFLKITFANEGYIKLKVIMQKISGKWFIIFYKAYEIT